MDEPLYVLHQTEAFAGRNNGQEQAVAAGNVRRRNGRDGRGRLQMQQLPKVGLEDVHALEADELQHLHHVGNLLQPLEQHVVLRPQRLHL